VALGAAASDARAEASPRRAWLGVELAPSPAGGVLVKHVVRSSPAAAAGLADGDRILAVAGQAVARPEQVSSAIAARGAHSRVDLDVAHAGDERSITVTLGAFPGPEEVLRLDKVGTFAPSWGAVTPIAGVVPPSLASLRGRVVVLDFWATWCGPCRLTIPMLSRWQERYGPAGLAVIGITSDAVPLASRAATELSMRYSVATDPSEATAATFGVSALPTLYVIDRRGVVRDVVVGFDPARHARAERLLATLLAEPAP
jgi:thiol-disulfide isomerase/thioredoxin